MQATQNSPRKGLQRTLGLITALLLTAPSWAQVVVPPIVHWIGPDVVGEDATCDYATIQEALDDIFDCGIFACPSGRNELRLSADYVHSGQVVVSDSFDIQGGYLRRAQYNLKLGRTQAALLELQAIRLQAVEALGADHPTVKKIDQAIENATQ